MTLRLIHERGGKAVCPNRARSSSQNTMEECGHATENILSGVTGEPSLQQAEGKIDGAKADSDRITPDRYARFMDGANAAFREREKSIAGVALVNNSAADRNIAGGVGTRSINV